jgi:hypothetical protein
MRCFLEGIERMRWIVWRSWFKNMARMRKKTRFLPNTMYDLSETSSFLFWSIGESRNPESYSGDNKRAQSENGWVS